MELIDIAHLKETKSVYFKKIQKSMIREQTVLDGSVTFANFYNGEINCDDVAEKKQFGPIALIYDRALKAPVMFFYLSRAEEGELVIKLT